MGVFSNLGNFKNKSQKTGTIVLAIFSVGILIFWGVQMNNNIKSPFQLPDEYKNLAEKENLQVGTCTGPGCLSSLSLTDADTDKDGLSDWEELNVYFTSPYLPDTDSDGILDRDEILNNTDPNCPEGTDCKTGEYAVEFDTGIESELENLSNNISVPEDEERLQEALSGNMTVDSLRDLLVESGLDQQIVDALSDQDLMLLYQSSFEEQGTNLEQEE